MIGRVADERGRITMKHGDKKLELTFSVFVPIAPFTIILAILAVDEREREFE